MDTQALRKEIRLRRRQLSQQTIKRHSILLSRQASACHPVQHSKRIAFYFAADGEMDPTLLVDRARASGKRCFYPVLRKRPATSLWFAEHKTDRKLILNRFGIPEPADYHNHIIMPWGLDLILLPLVAFDLSGNRMGMGGGFYDRTLAFKNKRTHWHGPKLIGLAHELQKVDHIPRQSWDIPLDGVITEKQFYNFN